MAPETPTRVIVCDDHPIFRGGVVAAVTEEPGVAVVAEASTGSGCISKLKLYQPDVLITDLSMPDVDGFQVVEWAVKWQPRLRIFVLSMYSGLSYVTRARELGASGFLAKEDAQSELVRAIFEPRRQFYTSESIGSSSPEPNLNQRDLDFENKLRKISPAELKVLKLLTQSFTSREIASQLNLSVRTIEAHRHSIAEKLEAKGPNKLLEVAVLKKDAIANA